MATIKLPPNPSKQPQTTPENSPASNPTITGPFIDYLTLTVSTNKRQLSASHGTSAKWREFLLKQLNSEPAKFEKLKLKDNGLSCRVRIANKKSSRFPRIAIDCKKSPYLRLEFNPAKLGLEGIAEMVQALTFLSPSIINAVRYHSKVSRIDIAYDLHPFQMQDMLALNDQTKTCRTYIGKGELETIYFGRRKGNHTRIYDKSKEQTVKKRVVIAHKVRIERVLRNTKMALADTPNLVNPFLPLKLLTRVWPSPPESVEKKKFIWRMFQAAAAAEGTDVALKWLSEEKRISYRVYLKKNTHSWWKPELFWGKWKDEAKSLLSSIDPSLT